MRICLVLEGSYPYVHGGVSTWMTISGVRTWMDARSRRSRGSVEVQTWH